MARLHSLSESGVLLCTEGLHCPYRFVFTSLNPGTLSTVSEVELSDRDSLYKSNGPVMYLGARPINDL